MKKSLAIIVISQFFCTSLWFAGNAVLPDLVKDLRADSGLLANLVSAVQLGFITGTLLSALTGLADKVISTRLFFTCAFAAALLNAMILFAGPGNAVLLVLRFLTGFFLAGIYPVGMKIASDHSGNKPSKSLGFLVGALVLGTSFPHLLKSLNPGYSWKVLVLAPSLLSAAGGTMMLLLIPPTKIREINKSRSAAGITEGFKIAPFRQAALGYFGHMWELYTFWAFLPVILLGYKVRNHFDDMNVTLWSFLIIASGFLSCIAGGYLAERITPKRLAFSLLSVSGICCLLSPLFLLGSNETGLFIFLLIWGMAVIADSPLFSAIVADSAPPESKGTLLTIVTCGGFFLTIISIQITNTLSAITSNEYLLLWLVSGPVFGLSALLIKTPTAMAFNQIISGNERPFAGDN